jgi:hypothetical protein
VAVLFLDPLALGLLMGLLVYVWVVWRGSFRRWFGRNDGWTAFAWPLPAVAIGVPIVAGMVTMALGLLDWPPPDEPVLGALTYGSAYLVPLTIGTLLPPRWVLPRWARRRLVALPAPDGASIPALLTERGHGSLARWVWWVDAVPGRVLLDGLTLRFRAEPAPGGTQPPRPDRVRTFVDEALGEPELTPSGEVRVTVPRGGRWTHDDLEVDLTAVDGWHVRAGRPWRRDGVVVLEVGGRRPLHLWVADVRRVTRMLPARR